MAGKQQNAHGALPPGEDLDRAVRVLRLLAHRDRLMIVAYLRRHGAVPVHALTAALGMEQAATSHHLSRMSALGIVEAERRGREVWYRVQDTRCFSILDCISRRG